MRILLFVFRRRESAELSEYSRKVVDIIISEHICNFLDTVIPDQKLARTFNFAAVNVSIQTHSCFGLENSVQCCTADMQCFAKRLRLNRLMQMLQNVGSDGVAL